MRIKINFKSDGTTLPINNHHLMNGYLGKIDRERKWHGKIGNKINISMLCGGNHDGNGRLTYDNGAFFVVSSEDQNFLDDFLMGVLSNQIIESCGLKFSGIEHISEHIYDGFNIFSTLSPIIIKNDGRFLTIEDDGFDDKFKEYLMKVAEANFVGFKREKFDIEISKIRGKKKKIMIGDKINFGSSFAFKMVCPKYVAEFFYNTGIGLSRSSGFGTIYGSENKKHYDWNQKNGILQSKKYNINSKISPLKTPETQLGQELHNSLL